MPAGMGLRSSPNSMEATIQDISVGVTGISLPSSISLSIIGVSQTKHTPVIVTHNVPAHTQSFSNVKYWLLHRALPADPLRLYKNIYTPFRIIIILGLLDVIRQIRVSRTSDRIYGTKPANVDELKIAVERKRAETRKSVRFHTLTMPLLYKIEMV